MATGPCSLWVPAGLGPPGRKLRATEWELSPKYGPLTPSYGCSPSVCAGHCTFEKEHLKEKTWMEICAFCSRSFGTGKTSQSCTPLLIGIWAPCPVLGPRDHGRAEVQDSQNGSAFPVG